MTPEPSPAELEARRPRRATRGKEVVWTRIAITTSLYRRNLAAFCIATKSSAIQTAALCTNICGETFPILAHGQCQRVGEIVPMSYR